MNRVAWRSIRAHAKQFLLTALAVVLGVAFLSGTLALRAVLSETFSSLISSTLTADLYVTGEPLEGEEGSGTVLTQPVDSSLAEQLMTLDGVAAAHPASSLMGTLVGADDTPDTSGGAPTLIIPLYDDDPGLSWLAGRSPSGSSEIALESDALTRSGLAVGDTTHLVVQGSPAEVTVVGEFSYGTSMAGATLVGMDPAWLMGVAAPDGQVAQIEVIVTAPATAAHVEEVKREIADVLPDGVRVQTRDQAVDEQNAYVESILGFVSTFLLVFVVLAMFVGSFIIMNTFAMSVRQRQKEFALLRAVGASPGSVFRTVLLQALVIGLVGSLVGVAVGAGILRLLMAGMESLGMPLPGGVPLTGPLVAVSLGAGLLVTVVGALLPARDAALTAPVEAMRDVSGAREKSLVVRTVTGALLLSAGLAATAAAWTQDGLDQRRWVLAAGAAGVLIGLLLVSPVLARPVVAVLGLPFRVLRPAGRLAVRNISHNPRRTANTSGALMVGMALVCAGATLAASVNDSTADVINDSMKADLIVQPTSTAYTARLPADMVERITALDGVAATAPFTAVTASVLLPDGTQEPSVVVNVVEAATYASFYDLGVEAGSMGDLDADHVAAYASTGLALGDEVVITGPAGTVQATVAAIIDPKGVTGSFYATPELAAAVGSWTGSVPTEADQVLDSPYGMFLTLEPGADLDAVRTQVQDIVAPTYTYSVQDATDFSDQVGQQVNRVLAVLYALLGLSVAIAILGIVNTLVLSVTERTREIGLMRAVGLGRAQLGAEIMTESVLTALYGTVVGGAAGVFLAAALRAVLEDEGLTTLSIPWDQLVAMLVLSVVVGMVAAVWPALRASRLPVLDAIATE